MNYKFKTADGRKKLKQFNKRCTDSGKYLSFIKKTKREYNGELFFFFTSSNSHKKWVIKKGTSHGKCFLFVVYFDEHQEMKSFLDKKQWKKSKALDLIILDLMKEAKMMEEIQAEEEQLHETPDDDMEDY